MPPLRLELAGISKRYDGVQANDAVDLKVSPGEIHGVLGENGAGKSTLMKIIYGAVRPDAGAIRFDGEPIALRGPEQARALGIAMVFQHFSLFETLTVGENVWLGLDRSVSLATVTERLRVIVTDYGLDVDPRRLVYTLSVGERQRVEIARALLGSPRLLILDEPTSVLPPQAIENLFDTVRKLAARGCSVLYISHKLDEVCALCHRATVLRGGKVVAEVDPARETPETLARLMIDADIPELVRTEAHAGEVLLEVKRFSRAPEDPYGVALKDVELCLRAGEIVGIAGISGSGQNELLSALSGETPAEAGRVFLDGADVGALAPRARREKGVHFVPEERLDRGAVGSFSLAANTLLTRGAEVVRHGFVKWKATERLAERLIATFDVRCEGPRAAANSLSGGNLQKFIVGREIDAAPRVLLVAQPTWGVDVGAARRIRAELLALRQRGVAVLLVSEDLDELFELSDRLHVMARGKLSPSIAIADATPARIGEWMSGLFTNEATVRSAEAANAYSSTRLS
jgi:simple sugar transport system ATP-binding protein